MKKVLLVLAGLFVIATLAVVGLRFASRESAGVKRAKELLSIDDREAATKELRIALKKDPGDEAARALLLYSVVEDRPGGRTTVLLLQPLTNLVATDEWPVGVRPATKEAWLKQITKLRQVLYEDGVETKDAADLARLMVQTARITLDNSKDDRQRDAAAFVLGMVGESEGVAHLVERLKSEKAPAVPGYLARIGPHAAAALRKTTQNRESLGRTRALDALARVLLAEQARAIFSESPTLRGFDSEDVPEAMRTEAMSTALQETFVSGLTRLYGTTDIIEVLLAATFTGDFAGHAGTAAADCAAAQAEAKKNLKAIFLAEQTYRAEHDSYAASVNFRGNLDHGYEYGVLAASAASFLAEAKGKVDGAEDVWLIDEKNDLRVTRNACARAEALHSIWASGDETGERGLLVLEGFEPTDSRVVSRFFLIDDGVLHPVQLLRDGKPIGDLPVVRVRMNSNGRVEIARPDTVEVQEEREAARAKFGPGDRVKIRNVAVPGTVLGEDDVGLIRVKLDEPVSGLTEVQTVPAAVRLLEKVTVKKPGFALFQGAVIGADRIELEKEPVFVEVLPASDTPIGGGK